MDVVGRRFGAHEIFLPEVLLAARAMKAGVDLLEPLLLAEEVPSLGKVVIGTVKGDLHDIGKNLVGIMLEGAGFEVIDLGSDVTAERFVETAQSEGAAVVGIAREFARHSSVPVIIQSNAGLPEHHAGEFVYSESPDFMAAGVGELMDLGVSIIGGCCGTTSAHIRAIRSAVDTHQ